MSYFSLKQKLRLMRSLFTKASPAYVQFYVTARCNLACEQCNIIYAYADSQEMNLNQIEKMAENMAEIGVCIVLLIGGEPFVRKDLPEIVKAFTDVGIHVRLQTNGIATRDQIEKCVKAGAYDISVSLDSLDPATQVAINGQFTKSWDRAIESMAVINDVFPEEGTAFFGTVLMPRNIHHIADVIEFGDAIGWSTSLVPAHISALHRPKGFRAFDDEGVCRFNPNMHSAVRKVIDHVKLMKKKGSNVYDSYEYLEDIYRFIVEKPIRWRRRNNNVCDSPGLYFAIEPNGNLSPCCDFRLSESYSVYDNRFPSWFRGGEIHSVVYHYTRNCEGCMYGSYPEVSISARYLIPMFERFICFNFKPSKLPKLTVDEMKGIAMNIFKKNQENRDAIVLQLQQETA